MGFFALFPYDEQSHFDVMDTLFFVGVNAGLLILLIFGLVSARAKILSSYTHLTLPTKDS